MAQNTWNINKRSGDGFDLVHPDVDKPIVTQHPELVEGWDFAQVARLYAYPCIVKLGTAVEGDES